VGKNDRCYCQLFYIFSGRAHPECYLEISNGTWQCIVCQLAFLVHEFTSTTIVRWTEQPVVQSILQVLLYINKMCTKHNASHQYAIGGTRESFLSTPQRQNLANRPQSVVQCRKRISNNFQTKTNFTWPDINTFHMQFVFTD